MPDCSYCEHSAVVLVSSLFYKWGNGSTEKLSGLPKVTQLASVKLGKNPVGLVPDSTSSPLSCPASLWCIAFLFWEFDKCALVNESMLTSFLWLLINQFILSHFPLQQGCALMALLTVLPKVTCELTAKVSSHFSALIFLNSAADLSLLVEMFPPFCDTVCFSKKNSLLSLHFIYFFYFFSLHFKCDYSPGFCPRLSSHSSWWSPHPWLSVTPGFVQVQTSLLGSSPAVPGTIPMGIPTSTPKWLLLCGTLMAPL